MTLPEVITTIIKINFQSFFDAIEEDDDYQPETQTITFPAGETSMTVTVDTVDDSISELTETFKGVLSDPNGNGVPISLGGQNTAMVDINDNDRKKLFLLCILHRLQLAHY